MRNDEKAMIGAAILSGTGHLEIDLSPADFSDEFYGAVWKSILTMREVDTVTLESEFIQRRADLSSTIEGLPTMTNMKKIAARIREHAHKGRVLKAIELAHARIKGGESIDSATAQIISAIDDERKSGTWKPLTDFLRTAYQDIETAQTQKQNINFQPSGFSDFDKVFGGLQKAGLIIVAGRPSMGKSAWAAGVARSCGKPVLFLSLEMTGKQLAMRYFASEAGVSLQKMMQGGLNSEDWGKLAAANSDLMDVGIYINDARSRGMADIAAEARRFKRVHGDCGLIVIDYLTLLALDESKTKNEAVSNATRMLKCLAGEIDCPIILLSQLNRDLEKRANKMPIMADLRDSGAIEQDADQIIFPYRPEVYDKAEKWKGIALVNMAKNRNGATGTVQMTWIGEQTAFKDFATEEF